MLSGMTCRALSNGCVSRVHQLPTTTVAHPTHQRGLPLRHQAPVAHVENHTNPHTGVAPSRPHYLVPANTTSLQRARVNCTNVAITVPTLPSCEPFIFPLTEPRNEEEGATPGGPDLSLFDDDLDDDFLVGDIIPSPCRPDTQSVVRIFSCVTSGCASGTTTALCPNTLTLTHAGQLCLYELIAASISTTTLYGPQEITTVDTSHGGPSQVMANSGLNFAESTFHDNGPAPPVTSVSLHDWML